MLYGVLGSSGTSLFNSGTKRSGGSVVSLIGSVDLSLELGKKSTKRRIAFIAAMSLTNEPCATPDFSV